jgi:hypothetical protein
MKTSTIANIVVLASMVGTIAVAIAEVDGICYWLLIGFMAVNCYASQALGEARERERK